MTKPAPEEVDISSRERPATLRADPLALGVVFMLSVTVVQRMMGFLRSILFCRFLEEDQLGQWSLAFSFLLIIAPLAVLGIPGSFGRYVEYYRQRGQLRQFLRRTSIVSAALGLMAVVLVCLGRDWVARIIFNDPGQSQLVLVMGIALIAVIAFNFIAELLTAMRQIRAVSLMQFANSLVFAIVGLALICFTGLGAAGVVMAYAAGCAVACVPALLILGSSWRSTSVPSAEMTQSDLWSKLLPFAAWVWAINLIANLFVMADRYMIVQFSGLDAQQAQALVGQYHASRVVPVLMIAVAGMLATVILPYLSSDWEAGRRGAAVRRVKLSLKLVGLSFTAGGVLILMGSPLLFGWFLDGRYNEGLTVLPWTVVYCIWFSLGLTAQNYLWCAEKAKWIGVALLFGLVANIGLNLVLLPLLGLLGAVLATAVANGTALTLVYWLSRRTDMEIDRGTVIASVLPLVLCLGIWPATLGLLAIGWFACRSHVVFDRDEKDQLARFVTVYLEKVKQLTGRRMPASA